MPGRADLRSRLMATFKAEAGEHLQAIGGHLLALEPGLPPDQLGATVEAAFRAMHTLKGAARSVGLTDMERRCQQIESLLSRMKKGELLLTREVLQQLREAAAALDRLLGAAAGADAGGAEPHPGSGTPSGAPAPPNALATASAATPLAAGGEPRLPAVAPPGPPA